MSTMLEQTPLTAAQRTAKANEEAAFILGLEDVKLVTAVLLEWAVGELRRNEAFRQDVREAYQASAKPKRAAPAPRQPRQPKPKVVLTPLKVDEMHQINFVAALDPYYLFEMYGVDQFPLALGQYTAKKLMDEAVPFVQKRHPGTQPTNSKKPTVIAYLVQYVANR